ncbi:DUF445 domain-containing protein [Anaeromicropila populeti]|uniref:DUF445 domain-containing protein n=1 Tax=Anaeromicropila populeti TaxID=37658 RepID=A0A1I6IF74_9FIRM|nr:DUF445 family protein [Anaeromicropila populeti]SFR65304.1 Alpha/beta hydrolase of unknown function [Anaeromicropila populeti]
MSWIFEPLICAVIGGFTNYLAILMLFRPYEEKYIGKIKVPFTPGIISRRKNTIARAVGQVVAEHLIDISQITEILCSQEVSDRIVSGVLNYKVSLSDQQSEKIGEVVSGAICSIRIDKIVSEELKAYITAKISGNIIFSRLINEKMKEDFCNSVGERVKEYVDTDGKRKISDAVEMEIKEVSELTILEVLERYKIDSMEFEAVIRNKYKEIVEEKFVSIFETINISGIIENSINEMKMEELEKVVLKVMGKELNSLVVIGFAIGFLIGLINIIL